MSMNKTWPISNFMSEKCSGGRLGSYLESRDYEIISRGYLRARLTWKPNLEFQDWGNLCRNLDQQPTNNRIGDRHLVNVAPLQLGEEVARVHGDGDGDSVV